MRIVMLTVGSRGDVQPIVALGRGLATEGHEVIAAASAAYAGLVHEAGLAFAPLEGDPRELLAGVKGRAWVESGRNPLRFLRQLRELAEPLADRLLEDSMRACAGAQAIVWTPLAGTGYHIAERYGVPGVLAALQPLSPAAEFPALPCPDLPALGGPYNLASHHLLEQLGWLQLRPVANRWRALLGLPGMPVRNPYGLMRRRGSPILYGFSSRVVPRPRAWGDWAHVCGYWFDQEPEGWRPSAELESFLDAGSAPIGLTAGSMAYSGGERVLWAALEAVAAAGERALLFGEGLEGLGPLPGEAFVAGEVPHTWLFPRLAAVLHHGGAGTTAAALRAGLPSVVTPYFADQHFWARRVAALGAGPRPVPARRATALRLGAALDAATHDPRIHGRTIELSRLLSAEDGVAAAVEMVRGLLHAPAPKPARRAAPRIATR